ncbi:F-box/kelch-repeat protein [Striga hermonthica]|uniref:F-box/kelch-repeat protein n=1 Tax=Striga hermonthica TaxID=68872 RepID=A0A9N7N5R5_STRHE|nr:F-box/kelch-repeat protein [Striga hermonthica]
MNRVLAKFVPLSKLASKSTFFSHSWVNSSSLVTSSTASRKIQRKNGYAALWNPTIDELKFFSESSVPRPPRRRNTFFTYGFGLDHQYDYKVIRFVKYMFLDDYTENILVELYSLKSDSWKEVMYPHFPMAPANQEGHFTAPRNQGVHINDILYWLCDDGVILSFDLTTEEFPSTPLIPLSQTYPLNCCSNNVLLVEYNGQLATIVHSRLEKKS